MWFEGIIAGSLCVVFFWKNVSTVVKYAFSYENENTYTYIPIFIS